ncbi:MAG: hypothetical protein A3B68_07510 [Candidatus Melainabacteria bacterium RIFCSPHIGHO2_02_FULL_34_12]|nr:MAG: hypothetical protein A3B68_07510 [Candidatus Melainabacteria bacterium RIFCSPHIGHO2_02_FULL_34_12]
MTIATEYKTFEKEIANLTFMNNTFEQFISSAINAGDDQTISQVKQEIISQGKDNIQTRIHIKKAIKMAIANLESLIKEAEKSNSNKNMAKSLKNRFLTLVSILDKTQLEWQKHDLAIRL